MEQFFVALHLRYEGELGSRPAPPSRRAASPLSSGGYQAITNYKLPIKFSALRKNHTGDDFRLQRSSSACPKARGTAMAAIGNISHRRV